ALGLRHRRGHDLRRTFITLAQVDGARRDILERVTHNPKSGAAIDLYTSYPWASLCEEVAKLKVSRTPRGRVVQMSAAAQGGESSSTELTPEFTPAETNISKLREKRGGGAGSRNVLFTLCGRSLALIPGVYLPSTPLISRSLPASLAGNWQEALP